MDKKSLGDMEDSKDVKKTETPKAIDYHFLDGLRGFGAFAVYLHHFMNNYCPLQTIKQRDDGLDLV